jgi:hypothetical protein
MISIVEDPNAKQSRDSARVPAVSFLTDTENTAGCLLEFQILISVVTGQSVQL